MPVAINQDDRPGSANTIPVQNGNSSNNNTNNNGNAAGVNMNATSAPPPRPTTTSRRGGRQRSRSPVAMGSRGGAAVPPATSSNPGDPASAGAPPPSGENPSSAAAAAAAVAAKAYSNGGRGPVPWQEGQEEGGYLGGYTDRPPAALVPLPPSNTNWPGESGPPPPHRGQPYPGYEPRQFGRDEYGERRYRERYDRYGPPPGYDYRFARGGPPPPHHYSQHHQRSRGEQQLQQYHRGEQPLLQQQHRHRQPDPRGPAPLNGQQLLQRGGTTSLVIGGATPIHLPKSPVATSSQAKSDSSKSRQQHHGSAASVFRGRPEDTANAETTTPTTSTREPTDEDSPSKILLSLRTPTTSFEDRKDASPKKRSTEPSPAGPPPLQSPNGRSMDQLFERSPGESVKAAGSLDMAPSFNLFNQSFDSFGDAHYFNVDSTLQADSFGLGRVESVGGDAAAAAAVQQQQQQVIRKNSSGGNFAAQLMASNSGALNIGYSPVNSFGNASSAGRRGGNMMVVGGQDARSASPTEVLGMYRSYSGGNGRALDDSHLRMSAGSFGGPSMSMYNRSPYGDPSASPSSYYMASVRSQEGAGPPFYFLLRKFKAAFRDCTFLLPGIKSDPSEGDPNNADSPGEDSAAKAAKWDPAMKMIPGQHPYQGMPPAIYGEPGPQDIAVARRRVESSVCAFGGNLQREQTAPQAKDNKEAIFREKDEKPDEEKSATVTPASTKSTDTSGVTKSSKKRKKYEEELPGRYYENESRLSWEFEEDPPIEIPAEDDNDIKESGSEQTASKADEEGSKDSKTNPEDDQYCKSVGSEAGADGEKSEGSSPQAKMRYRCKLCGQPKQNHRCPYQQSLARSIGTMVYPAVNAFTADEPGTIAAPLSEMNNFIDIKDSSSEGSPNRPTPERIRRMSSGPMVPSAQVTPESLRSNRGQTQSPSSFAATPGRASLRGSARRSSSKKRMYSQMKGGSNDQGDLLFVESMDLKPEQFRIVSHLKAKKGSTPYIYPALPLPYAQRKRLSDNLFSLSNEVPKLTDECAKVLREAREKDMWDLAVAELMTQVIVILHCSDRDYRFEGLRQYLLTLGIAT